MKKLTTTLCLTVALLFGCTGVCKSADFQRGLTAHKSGDYAITLREWKPLAKQGDAAAQFNLGVMYEKGQGVPEDDKTAVKWYRLAAEEGIADAQFNLGNMYEKGQGIPQDYKTAVKWYKLAAKQGHANGQSNLGVMYRDGRGVPQDYKTAVKWYKLAAEQGLNFAQHNLGTMYYSGQGVLKNYVSAHMWFNLGSTSGKSKNASKNRDIIAKLMTPAQIAAAQKLARECVRKKYKGC